MRKKVFLLVLLFVMFTFPNVYAEEKYSFVTGDINTAGSEVCFDEECFYVVENKGYYVKLITKYSLTLDDKPVQSEHAEGLKFSETDYWGEVTVGNPKYVYDSKSNLYKYVEAYKKNLLDKGVIIKDARLINQEELLLAGVDIESYTWKESIGEWFVLPRYWSGVAYDDSNIWTSELEQAHRSNDSYFGIRPIIEVPTGWFDKEEKIYLYNVKYIESSEGVVSNSNNEIDLEFNDLKQYVRFETVIYNDGDADMFLNDIEIENLSENFFEVKLDEKSKNVKLSSNTATKVYFEINTLSIEGAGYEINDEINVKFKTSDINLNPETASNVIEFFIFILILLVVLYVINTSMKSGKKKVMFVSILLLICTSTYVYANEYKIVKLTGNIKYSSQNIIESTGTTLNKYSVNYKNSKDVWKYHNDVKKISISSLMKEPKSYYKKFDLSQNNDGRVWGYLVKNDDDEVPYDLHIIANGVIKANNDSSFLFSFSNLESIAGIENIDFRSTISMKGMFVGNNKLKSVNIKALDMTNTKDTSFMFYDCRNLKFSENDFNLDNVEEKNLMFNQYLYNVIKKDSISDVDYNYLKTQPPSGKILINTTKDDKFPIYYYRSEVNDNNVKFANFCWHMVRTTDTGGIKLIYNGIPASDGSCNNTGVNSTIGNSKIAGSYDLPTYMGYMYGDKYNIKNNGYTMLGQVIVGHDITAETKYYYAKDVVYQSGVYHLQEPTLSRWADKYTEPVGYYTCVSDTETSCKYVYYIVGALEDKFYSGTMSNGTMGEDKKAVFYKDYTISNGKVELLDKVEIPLIDFYNSYEDYTGYYCDSGYIYNMSAGGYYVDAGAFWMFGKDYKYENGKYVLKDTYFPKTGYSKEYSTIGNDYRYTCFNESGECTNLYYAIIIKPGNIVSILLSNGDGINEAYNKMYAQVNNSDIKTMLDNWYKNNMVNYTSKLEDTIWYNDKTYYGPLQGNGEVSSINANNTYTGHASCSRKYMAVPVLKYYNDNDKYTVSDDIGNGALTYPVGLITYDELAYGYNGCYKSKSTSYLNIGYAYWTMTPFAFDTSAYYAALNTSGKVEKKLVNSNLGVRPMISLKHDAEYFGGNGTVTNPYVVE